MSIFNKRRARSGRLAAWMRPRLEVLEGRVVLSTFKVNTTLDSLAVNLKTGQDASGHISLRSAIMAADARGGSNKIKVPAGTFTLTFLTVADASLDIMNNNLKIMGKGAGATIIDGGQLASVFGISNDNVTISGLTIEDGVTFGAGGGAILNSGGDVTLKSVTLSNNEALGNEGADGQSGGTDGGDGLSGLPGSDAFGGAILNEAGSLSITNCTISNNEAVGGAGGHGGAGGPATGASSPAGVDGQPATGGSGANGGAGGSGEGGGIFNAAGASLSISGTTIAQNMAVGGVGGAGGAGGTANGGAGGADSVALPGAGGNGTGGTGIVGGAGGNGVGGGMANFGSVTFSGKASTISGNTATGAPGGAGGAGGAANGGGGGNGASGGEPGGNGGSSDEGDAGAGGHGGNSFGGGIENGAGASLVSTVAMTFIGNQVQSGDGGTGGGLPGFGSEFAGQAGSGGPVSSFDQAEGGSAQGANGGAGGAGGNAFGAGLCNGGTVVMEAPSKSRAAIASSFTGNQADGGEGGDDGFGGGPPGGSGGSGIGAGSGSGGAGGPSTAGAGGNGGPGGSGIGGGVCNLAGAAMSLTGITVKIEVNQASGGAGGFAGDGGFPVGGDGGKGTHLGGAGADAIEGNGGDGGAAGSAFGGGIANLGALFINPQQGAKKRSKQAKATDTITGNGVLSATGGDGGGVSKGTAGLGGSPGGANGLVFDGTPGADGTAGSGLGGGAALGGSSTILNTTITGNQAATGDNDEDNNFNASNVPN